MKYLIVFVSLILFALSAVACDDDDATPAADCDKAAAVELADAATPADAPKEVTP